MKATPNHLKTVSSSGVAIDGFDWPELDYELWKPTYETLHRWLQIVGKIRLCHEPWVNHSWSSALYVTARGLGTSAIPLGPQGERNFSIDFDFVDHQLILQSSDVKYVSFSLKNEAVDSFYSRVMTALDELEIETSFAPYPNELTDMIPFAADSIHASYDRLQARNCWQALVRANNFLKTFRAGFVGKCSPVHFFWGAFDLAVTRFSGRRAPEHPGGIPHLPDRVTREAYSHEVSSCGFWPGNEIFPHAAFYSYAYPQPQGFAKTSIAPADAFYHHELGEFLLPYEAVRQSSNPQAIVLDFLQSTYEAAAELAGWDRDQLEESPHLRACQQIFSDGRRLAG